MAAVHLYILSLLPVEIAPGFISLSTDQREQGSEGRRDEQGWIMWCGKDLTVYLLSTEKLDVLRFLTLTVRFTSFVTILQNPPVLAQGQMRPLKWGHMAMVTSSEVQTGFMKKIRTGKIMQTCRFCSEVNIWSFLFIFHSYPAGIGAWFWIYTVQWFICCLNLKPSVEVLLLFMDFQPIEERMNTPSQEEAGV